MSIQANLDAVRKLLPAGVSLVLVSKTRSNEEIMQAYDAGQRLFGESKAQEMLPKHESLPGDIQWHMVGHLQRNKVKYIAPFVSLIHSVDSLKLLKEINKQGKKHDRVIPCLLQMHIADESTKFGMDRGELTELLESEGYQQMQHVRIRGLMGMATFTDDQAKVRSEFGQLKDAFASIKKAYFPKDEHFTELSMGMSDDFRLGIEEGSTMVRIGSAIFGERS